MGAVVTGRSVPDGLAGADAPEPQSRLGPSDGIPSADDEMAARCLWCEGYKTDVDADGLCEMCREQPRRPLSKVGEMDLDIMECGDPETSLHEAIRHFRWRAACEASVARELRQTAAAAKTDADDHSSRAEGFLMLATAMERMPITLAPTRQGDAQ